VGISHAFETFSSVVYDGEPLTAGTTYTLALYNNVSAGPALIPDFRVMQPAVRLLINNGLKNSSISNESIVSDIEWTAIQRADYFSKRNLYYDAIQALFSVGTPSPDLVTAQENIIGSACKNP
jgi:hypothetical protein